MCIRQAAPPFITPGAIPFSCICKKPNPMKPHSRKTPLRALVSGLLGILVFLIVLVVFRYVATHTSWPLFEGFVDLLFAYAPLIVLFSVLFMVGEIFAVFPFPFNLPFPLFNAVGSVLLVSFLLAVLKYVDDYFSTGISPALDIIALFLLPFVIIIVLIAGYVSIFAGLKSQEPNSSQEAGSSKSPQDCPSWETIGEEFRQMVADIIRKVRNGINKD